MPAGTPFRTLLEARSAVAVDLRDDAGEVLVASNLGGTMQLYSVGVDGGELHQLTDLDEPVTFGRYVPGTEDILIAHDAGGNERHQIRLVGRRGGEPRDLVVDPACIHIPGGISADGRRLAYVSNRRNGVDFDVYVRDIEVGEERCVLEGGWNRGAGFSPDGRWLAVIRAGHLPMEAHLWLIDIDSGERIHVAPEQPSRSAGAPSWFPDSASFLFTTDDGQDTEALARYDLSGRRWERLWDPGWEVAAVVSDDGSRVVAALNEGGCSRLFELDPRTAAPLGELALPGSGATLGFQGSPEPRLLCRSRRLVVSFTSTAHPSDIYSIDLGTAGPRRLHRVTASPSRIPASLGVEPELHRVGSFDGLAIPVFLYRPPRPVTDPAPVVLLIHGGPESQFVPSFNPVVLHLLDLGIAVVAPNVRGSTGYGAAYAHLDDGRLRLDSVGDLAAIHAWLPTMGLDQGRAALAGVSYGGYMVLAGLAFHPRLWAAGVSIVGISSLVSFLENTSPWRRAMREREYGSLEADRDFLEAASPLSRVDAIRAALLLIHGANDPRVPVSEAEQLHRVLGERGVACELVVYPDEGHGLVRLANRLDAYPRMAAFLERHLVGEVAAAGG